LLSGQARKRGGEDGNVDVHFLRVGMQRGRFLETGGDGRVWGCVVRKLQTHGSGGSCPFWSRGCSLGSLLHP
jgi:hypothetical protein